MWSRRSRIENSPLRYEFAKVSKKKNGTPGAWFPHALQRNTHISSRVHSVRCASRLPFGLKCDDELHMILARLEGDAKSARLEAQAEAQTVADASMSVRGEETATSQEKEAKAMERCVTRFIRRTGNKNGQHRNRKHSCRADFHDNDTPGSSHGTPVAMFVHRGQAMKNCRTDGPPASSAGTALACVNRSAGQTKQ